MTPKAPGATHQEPPLGRTAPEGDDDRSAEMFLLEDGREGDDTSVIYLARVRNPEHLLKRRGMHFHGDVIEALSDLIVSFVGGDPSNGPDSRGRSR